MQISKMNIINLQYGNLKVLIESDIPITIPLPLEHMNFPLWIKPMQIKISLFSSNNLIIRNEQKDIPDELYEFYSAMKLLNVNCTSPCQHCNFWWKERYSYFCYFPYETDKFFLKVTPLEQHIIVYGNEFNLNRVIIDLLSCFSVVPPLHGAALINNEKTFILLGKGGCGKTRILNLLLNKGYTYVADEEIFWVDEEIFCCGRAIVEKEGRLNHFPNKYIKSDSSSLVTNVFLLTKDMNDNTIPMLLPSIARQSFWAQMLIPKNERHKMYERLSVAIEKYTELYNTAERILVEHSEIDKSIRQIERMIIDG